MRLRNTIIGLCLLSCLIQPVLAKKHKTHHIRKPARFLASAVKFAKPKALPKKSAYVAAASVYGISQLARELDQMINKEQFNADVSVYVKSMKYGDALYSRHIYHPLTPASTLKIFTAEAALIYLGPEYRFSTQLLTDAKTVKNSILQGNLYIVLSGDPSLTYNDLLELLLTLRSQKIQAIAGNVYIDSSAYDQRFYGPGWDAKDKYYCYGAPISAGIVNHNCLPFTVTPSKISGGTAHITTSPHYFYPLIKNSVITKAVRSRACSIHLSSDPGSVIYIDGCMSRGGYAWGTSTTIANVPEYDRALFKSLLKRLSINVFGKVVFGSAPQNLALVGQHASKPLRLLINDMLKKSDNIIAGALFKKMGQLYSHQPGSWENGSKAVTQILAKHAGVNIAGIRILDGSGVSADNLATPAQMMQVLDFAYHHPTSYEFISALPVAGIDGTLKHRMWNIARKVRAKTGTISGVISLAGYAISGDKEPLAFVIMINGNKGMSWSYRSLEDQIATVLTRYRRLS